MRKIIFIHPCNGVSKMSDMKHYIGKYSYSGKFKQQDDGSSLLEISEFEYDGKYYQPSEALRFKITPQPEESGWYLVQDESIGVCIGGVDFEEAIGNAIMDAALQYEDLICEELTKQKPRPSERCLQYEDLICEEGPMTESLKAIQEKVRTWMVHALDSKAQ